MQFKVGEAAVHPAYGVGEIIAIEEKEFSEVGLCLYYQIIFPKSTIWIPVATEATIGLRPVTAKSDLNQYRELLKSVPVTPKKNQPQRHHTDLTNSLKQGSFLAMCETVRDLTASDKQKSLGITAKTLLRKTYERLTREWAIAADISIAEATEEIDGLL